MVKRSHQRLLEHPNPSGKDLERRLRDNFKGRARDNTANDSYYTSSGGYGTLGDIDLQDDHRMDEDDIAPHRSTMTTTPEANTIATVTFNTVLMC
jgi:hypothetical protein